MTKKQEGLLTLLCEVDEICRRHGLRYVMAGGSLIGVVRHEGFIPWDDDIDIYMPRDDWYEFVRLSATELPADRMVECVECDREYTNTFARYGSTDSCSIHKHQIIGNDKAGEIIDVLTLDPIPAGSRKYKKYRNLMMIYSELVNLNSVFCDRWEIPVIRYRWNLFLYRVLGKDKALKRLEKKMFSFSEDKCPRYAMRWGGCPFLFSKEMMFPVKDGIFEGKKVMIPAHTSDYLIWHYGDEWRQIPAHAERESHDTISPAGLDYKEFRELYMPAVDAKKFRSEAIKRKLYYIGAARRNHQLVLRRQKLYASGTLMDLRAREYEMLGKGETLSDALRDRKYDTLSHIFEEYYRVQLSAEYSGREDFVNIYRFYHPTVLELEEEERQAALMTLLYTERVSKAFRLIQLWEGRKRKKRQFDSVLQDISTFRKAADLEEWGQYEEALALVDGLLTRYPDCPSFMKLKIRLMCQAADSIQEDKSLKQALAHCLELWPQDGYYLKYFGDLLFANGQVREAMTTYAYARSRTNDGVIMLEIEKKIRPELEGDMETIHNLLEMEPMNIVNGKEDPDSDPGEASAFVSFDDFEVMFDPEDLAHGAQECTKDAASLIHLWTRLLPDDPYVQVQAELVKAYRLPKASQLEHLAAAVERKLRRGSRHVTTPIDPEAASGTIEASKDVLTVIWARLGYPLPLARLRAEITLTDDEEGLKQIGVRLRKLEERGRDKAAAGKLLGDLALKQGCVKEAFRCYIDALWTADFDRLRYELENILLEDLRQGEARFHKLARRHDVTAFLDGWLDKYGSLEEIQKLVRRLSGAGTPTLANREEQN